MTSTTLMMTYRLCLWCRAWGGVHLLYAYKLLTGDPRGITDNAKSYVRELNIEISTIGRMFSCAREYDRPMVAVT